MNFIKVLLKNTSFNVNCRPSDICSLHTYGVRQMCFIVTDCSFNNFTRVWAINQNGSIYCNKCWQLGKNIPSLGFAKHPPRTNFRGSGYPRSNVNRGQGSPFIKKFQTKTFQALILIFSSRSEIQKSLLSVCRLL